MDRRPQSLKLFLKTCHEAGAKISLAKPKTFEVIFHFDLMFVLKINCIICFKGGDECNIGIIHGNINPFNQF